MLVFNPKKMDDLRIGANCLDDVIKNQVQKIEDEERAKRQEIANKKAAETKVWSETGYRCEDCSLALPGHERISRRPTEGCGSGGEGKVG